MTDSGERRRQAERLAAERLAETTSDDVLREVVILSIENQLLLEEIMSDAQNQAQLAAQEELDVQALIAAVPSIQSGINNLNTALQNAQAAGSAVDPALAQAAADLHNAVTSVQGINVPTAPPAAAPTPAAPAPAPAPAPTDVTGAPAPAPTAPTDVPTGGTGGTPDTGTTGAGPTGTGTTTIDLAEVGIATTVIADPTRW